MCDCNCWHCEYNPDKDISLYNTSELESMLNRIKEIHGEIPRSSLLLNFPPFSKEDILEELLLRSK